MTTRPRTSHARKNKLASAVIDLIGGATAFATWYGISRGLAHHWRGGFPPHTYLDLSARLAKRGIKADIGAWRMERKKKSPAASKPASKATPARKVKRPPAKAPKASARVSA